MALEKIITYLKQLELSDEEAKLYLTLLQSGPTSVRDLAETAGIKRTTAYFYIDLLSEKSLIMKLVKGSKKLVAAGEPEDLKTLVEAKLESAKTIQQGFPDMIKTLSSLPKSNGAADAEIKFYKGKNGVKKIYEEALNAKELRSYANLGDIAYFFPENLTIFDNAFETNKELKLFELIEDSPTSRKQIVILTQNKRYNFKFLPKGIKITASDILIYDGNVAIINVGDVITGVVFHNEDYFHLSKELFEHMWRTLPTIES